MDGGSIYPEISDLTFFLRFIGRIGETEVVDELGCSLHHIWLLVRHLPMRIEVGLPRRFTTIHTLIFGQILCASTVAFYSALTFPFGCPGASACMH
jgi:hypothetical protein